MRTDAKRGILVIGSAGEGVYVRLAPFELGAICAFVGSSVSGEASSVAFLDRHGTVLVRLLPAGSRARDGADRTAFASTFQYNEYATRRLPTVARGALRGGSRNPRESRTGTG